MFGRGHALLIGVGDDLPGTVDDAEGLAAVLRDPERCAYPREQVLLRTGAEATKEGIMQAFEELADAVDADSTSLVFFSGHGYRVEGASGGYFLMPFGHDLTRLADTAIAGDELAGALRAIESRCLVLLLDCCHAGGLDRIKGLGALKHVPIPPSVEQEMAVGRGRVVIASSRADEVSYAGRPYSAFTLALLEALAGVGAGHADGLVRVSDLALHTRETVPGRTHGRQHPILNFHEADNFVLAYYAGGGREPKGLELEEEPVIELPPEPGIAAGGSSRQGRGALRRLVSAALSDGELEDLAMDHFPLVYEQFSAGMSRDEKVRRLTDYAYRRGRSSRLVDRVRDVNPEAAERHGFGGRT